MNWKRDVPSRSSDEQQQLAEKSIKGVQARPRPKKAGKEFKGL